MHMHQFLKALKHIHGTCECTIHYIITTTLTKCVNSLREALKHIHGTCKCTIHYIITTTLAKYVNSLRGDGLLL